MHHPYIYLFLSRSLYFSFFFYLYINLFFFSLHSHFLSSLSFLFSFSLFFFLSLSLLPSLYYSSISYIFFPFSRLHTLSYLKVPVYWLSLLTCNIADLHSSDITHTQLQSAKILLLPSKYKIIMLPSNHNFFNISIATLDFSLLLLVKLSLLIPFGISSFFLSLYKVIALPTIAIAIVVALSRS